MLANYSLDRICSRQYQPRAKAVPGPVTAVNKGIKHETASEPTPISPAEYISMNIYSNHRKEPPKENTSSHCIAFRVCRMKSEKTPESGMKISAVENGADLRVYTQTLLEIPHMHKRRKPGDAMALFLSDRPPTALAMPHSSELATPSHRGVICQAQTQYCRVSGWGAVNARTTWNVWSARKRGTRKRTCSVRRTRYLSDCFRDAADGANVMWKK